MVQFLIPAIRAKMPHQSFIVRLRTSTPEDLAAWISTADIEEQRLFEEYYGLERHHRVRNAVLRNSEATSRSMRAAPVRKLGNVVVVPGIMGSELSVSIGGGRARVLWMSLLRMLVLGQLPQLALRPGGATSGEPTLQFTASGLLRKYYDELEQRLLANWNVRHFAYDWRRDLRTSAEQLNVFLKMEFADQPVHLVAHSMGGLICRIMMLARARAGQPEDKLLGDGGRLVMLGTPNLGSYESPQILTGIQDSVQQLIKGWRLTRSLTDADVARRAVLDVVKTFPSVYQMLPREEKRLFEAVAYRDVGASVVIEYFKSATDCHSELAKAVYAPLMHYVAGCHPDRPTASGLVNGGAIDSLQGYVWTHEGDGRVPHDLGRLPDVPMTFVSGDHGGLPENPAILESLDLLLETGKAGPLLKDRPISFAQRGAGVPPPPALDDDADAELWQKLLAAGEMARGRGERTTRSAQDEPQVTPVEATESLTEQELSERIVAGLLGAQDVRAGDRGVTAPPQGPPQGANVATAPRGEVAVEVVVAGIEDKEVVQGQAFPAGQPEYPVDALAVGHYLGAPQDIAEQSLDAVVSDGLDQRLNRYGADSSATSPENTRVFFQAVARGLYKGNLGELFLIEDVREISDSTASPSRTAALVGMGLPSEFGGPELAVLARQLAWTMGFLGRKHLATVLIGGRRGGMAPDAAVLAWLRGVAQAIAEMSGDGNRRRRLRKLTFVEHSVERAFQFEASLRRLAHSAQLSESETSAIRCFDVAGVTFAFRSWSKDYVQKLKSEFRAKCRSRCAEQEASLGEPDNRTADASVVRMTVESDDQRGKYRFSLLTADASIPEREVEIDYRIIDEANEQLVAQRDEAGQLAQGEVLTRLLTPRDFRNRLQTPVPLVLVLDARTARIPWELLTTVAGSVDEQRTNADRFLSLGRNLTRQFRSIFAPTPEPLLDASRDLRVLVVADPAAHARLPGAQEEAVLLDQLFKAFNSTRAPGQGLIRYKLLIGPREARRLKVLGEAMLNHYDVLHFSGHCYFDPDQPARCGWIFGKDADGKDELLAASELDRIDRVPRMVFSNACESGVTTDRAELRSPGMAPSFAEAFFQRGVRNFVCTGWPVNDRAARDFAVHVYAGMLGMDVTANPQSGAISFSPAVARSASQPRFLDLAQALRRAREAAIALPHGRRTWGAYQHYGDPGFRFFPDDVVAGPLGAAPPPAPAPAPAAAPGPGGPGGPGPRVPQNPPDDDPPPDLGGGPAAPASARSASQTVATSSQKDEALSSGLLKGKLAEVQTVIDAQFSQLEQLKSRSRVIEIRPGFKFVNGWITRQPAIVITVPPGSEHPENMEVNGIPVDFAPATPWQVLSSEGLVPQLDEDTLRGVVPASAREELLRPGESPKVIDAAAEETRKRTITKPYAPPKALTRRLKPTAIEKVVCHLSPDVGWSVLKAFLEEGKHNWVVGMYDFTAPHVRDALKRSVKKQHRLRLVLDPGQALGNGGDPDENAKANDQDEDDLIKEFRNTLGDRFDFAWAAVKTKDKVSGSTFPSAYHIKVAVRDDDVFWLSSGNWQSSNQPPDAEEFQDNLPALFNRYNREWHVVVRSKELADTFRGFLEHDLDDAADIQIESDRALRMPPVLLPELFVPLDEEELDRGRPAPEVRDEEIFTASDDRELTAIPLLTPDNYAVEVLKVLKAARTSLYFQNQYINIGKEISAEFEELLDVLKDRVRKIDDAKIILRKLPKARSMVETLIAEGFPEKKIRLMSNTHTKGIIVDSNVCVIGSHNWSSDGTTENRDASLIFDDARIAAYFERAFLHDWDRRARPLAFTHRTMPRIADRARGFAPRSTESGIVTPWRSWLEEE